MTSRYLRNCSSSHDFSFLSLDPGLFYSFSTGSMMVPYDPDDYEYEYSRYARWDLRSGGRHSSPFPNDRHLTGVAGWRSSQPRPTVSGWISSRGSSATYRRRPPYGIAPSAGIIIRFKHSIRDLTLWAARPKLNFSS